MTVVIIVDIAIIAVFLAADLITKYYAAKLLAGGGAYEAIKDVLSFQYTENDGAAFGMLSNARVLLCVFVGVVVLVLIGFLAYHIVKGKYKEKGGMLLHVAVSLVISGGIGNLVDRIAFGYVRDFIDYTVLYTLFKIDFAICNVADVVLTIGITLLVIYLIIYLVNDSKKSKKAAATESANLSEEAPSTATLDGDLSVEASFVEESVRENEESAPEESADEDHGERE